MQCTSCGHQNRPEASFCDTCGKPLSLASQVERRSTRSPLDTQETGPEGQGWHSPQRESQSNQSLPPDSPTQPTGPSLVGVASHIQHRSEQHGGGSTTQVLGFFLEQYDQSGNRTQAVAVELRGYSISGLINEGHQVEVFGEWTDKGIQTTQVHNLTTNSWVQAKEAPLPPTWLQRVLKSFPVVFVVLALIVVAGILFVGFEIFTHVFTQPVAP